MFCPSCQLISPAFKDSDINHSHVPFLLSTSFSCIQRLRHQSQSCSGPPVNLFLLHSKTQTSITVMFRSSCQLISPAFKDSDINNSHVPFLLSTYFSCIQRLRHQLQSCSVPPVNLFLLHSKTQTSITVMFRSSCQLLSPVFKDSDINYSHVPSLLSTYFSCIQRLRHHLQSCSVPPVNLFLLHSKTQTSITVMFRSSCQLISPAFKDSDINHSHVPFLLSTYFSCIRTSVIVYTADNYQFSMLILIIMCLFILPLYESLDWV